MSRPDSVLENVPLSRHTTLELGGPARFLTDVETPEEARDALRWAKEEGLPATVLGGGSNLVVADDGFAGVVLRMGIRGRRFERWGGKVEVTAGAGENWDDLVAHAVGENLAGLECLAGIPGLVGATPIQNVGAYGQEVADTLARVRVMDRETFSVHDIAGDDCSFAYRSSYFRRHPYRFVVLEVAFLLEPGGEPNLLYPELRRALGVSDDPEAPKPSLAQVRRTVIELRRSKSMVLDPEDPNRRSVGSFFVNPVVTDTKAREVVETALARGIIASGDEVPRYPTPAGGTFGVAGGVKIPAAWLIERAGFRKGVSRGSVGLSTRHTLALVNRGGGTSRELLELASEVQAGVAEVFGITLNAEPVFLGFDRAPLPVTSPIPSPYRPYR